MTKPIISVGIGSLSAPWEQSVGREARPGTDGGGFTRSSTAGVNKESTLASGDVPMVSAQMVVEGQLVQKFVRTK
jgi:hypothetical protein